MRGRKQLSSNSCSGLVFPRPSADPDLKATSPRGAVCSGTAPHILAAATRAPPQHPQHLLWLQSQLKEGGQRPAAAAGTRPPGMGAPLQAPSTDPLPAQAAQGGGSQPGQRNSRGTGTFTGPNHRREWGQAPTLGAVGGRGSVCSQAATGRGGARALARSVPQRKGSGTGSFAPAEAGFKSFHVQSQS